MKTALLIVNFLILDPQALQLYKEKVPATLKKYEATTLLSTKKEVILGEPEFSHVSIFRFPSKEAILLWFNSEDYKKLSTLRDKAIKAEFSVAEEI